MLLKPSKNKRYQFSLNQRKANVATSEITFHHVYRLINWNSDQQKAATGVVDS